MIKKAHDLPVVSQPAHADHPATSLPFPPVRITLAPTPTGVPLATLREIRFYSQDRLAADGTKIAGNGFAPAFLTLGRAVYVDVVRFAEIWRSQSEGGRHD